MHLIERAVVDTLRGVEIEECVGYVLFDEDGALATSRDWLILEKLRRTVYRDRMTLIGRLGDDESFRRITEAAGRRTGAPI